MYHPALNNPPQRGTMVLAITSGKGGVGKTNIAANLSICLAAEHERASCYWMPTWDWEIWM